MHQVSNRIGLRKDFKEFFFLENWAGILTLPLEAEQSIFTFFKATERDLGALTELNMKLGYEDQHCPSEKTKRHQTGWFALDG